jgi:hypothetical protein
LHRLFRHRSFLTRSQRPTNKPSANGVYTDLSASFFSSPAIHRRVEIQAVLLSPVYRACHQALAEAGDLAKAGEKGVETP